MATKTIAINPSFFKITDRPSKKRRQKKQKPLSSLLKPNLKQELINKIKDHKKNHEKVKEIQNMNSEIQNIDDKDELQKSIEYLNIISKKRKEERKNKRQERKKIKTQKNQYIPPPEPKYGILKNGSKPTYSQYKKTLKNNDEDNYINDQEIIVNNAIKLNQPPTISFAPIKIHNDSFEERQNKLNNLKYEFKVDNEKRKQKKKIKTIKRKIKLGKSKGKVGVLIKNRNSRKTIKKEITNLKKKSINNVKKYLRKHNLIKIGSAAPDNLLKNMYSESYLAGDIYNKNGEILLHNFIEDDK